MNSVINLPTFPLACIGLVLLLAIIMAICNLRSPRYIWKNGEYINAFNKETRGVYRFDSASGRFLPIVTLWTESAPLRNEWAKSKGQQALVDFWRDPPPDAKWIGETYYRNGKKVCTLVKKAGAYAPVLLENEELPKNPHIGQDDLYPRWVAERLAQAMSA